MMIGAIINLTKFNELDNARSHRRDINCVLLMTCQDRRSQGAGLKNKLIFDPKIETMEMYCRTGRHVEAIGEYSILLGESCHFSNMLQREIHVYKVN